VCAGALVASGFVAVAASAVVAFPGNIVTVAGTGVAVSSGDGGPATAAGLDHPYGVSVDPAGDVYVAESARVRKISVGGTITTVAGTGVLGFSGDGGPAVDAQLSSPTRAVVDAAGNVYIADRGNSRIRRVSSDGVITTIAGGGAGFGTGDGGPATEAGLAPDDVAVDASGDVLVADYPSSVRQIDPGGIITTIAGENQGLVDPVSLTVDRVGNVDVVDGQLHQVLRVARDGTVSALAGIRSGGFGGDGGSALQAEMVPSSVTTDAAGDLYIVDGHRIRRVDTAGVIWTIAGSGLDGWDGDNVPATSARLGAIGAIAVDAAGDVLLPDSENQRVREVYAIPDTVPEAITAVGARISERLTDRILHIPNVFDVHASPSDPRFVSGDAACPPLTYSTNVAALGTTPSPDGADQGRSALQQSVAGTFPSPSTGAGRGCVDIARSDVGPRATGTSGDSTSFEYYAFGLDAVTWASPRLAAPLSLTVQQLRDIFTCAITDWSQVGGGMGAIQRVLPPASSGTREAFVTDVLGLPAIYSFGATTGCAAALTMDENNGLDLLRSASHTLSQNEILPYASSQWVAQANNAANPSVDRRGGVRPGAISDTPNDAAHSVYTVRWVGSSWRLNDATIVGGRTVPAVKTSWRFASTVNAAPGTFAPSDIGKTLQGSTVYDGTTIRDVSPDGATATISPGARTAGTADLALGLAVVGEANVPGAPERRVVGVHYVYNVIDSTAPSYLSARALVGFADVSGGNVSGLCGGADASAIADSGFLDLPAARSAGGNVATCRIQTPTGYHHTPATASQISAGSSHTCAVITNGRVECWGNNGNGQLGDGTQVNRATPTAVTGLSGVTQIAAGREHTCALLSSGQVECWGLNAFGQLGDGTTTSRSVPALIAGLDNVKQISAGAFFTCAVTTDGTPKCWGQNDAGQIGDGSIGTDHLTPIPVAGLTTVTQIAAGYSRACALLPNGQVSCWGDNSLGALGDGTTITRGTPAPVSGLTNATQVAAGVDHSCAVTSNGQIECWGFNVTGDLGDGSTTNSTTPTTTQLAVLASAVTAGRDFTCALLADTRVSCWGLNQTGTLGDSTQTDRPLPVTVTGITNAVSVSAGFDHTCALIADGTAECWGANAYGQLGNSATSAVELTPVRVNL
jgi:alpha-tubulin suppressor-like RCC1 family protein